jgi:hypothetical protein
VVKGEPKSRLTQIVLTITTAQGEGLYSGKISKVIIPISEPLDHSETNPGEHWNMAVINCRQREVSYFNSLKKSGEFHCFQEASKDF